MRHLGTKSLKFFAMFLTFTLTLQIASPAFATREIIEINPPARHYYHHYDNDNSNSAAWGLGGLAAGLILGAVLSGSEKEQQPKGPVITDIEERLTAFSAQALMEAQKAIAQYGIDDGLSKINDYWLAQSYDTIYDPIGLKLSVTGTKNFKLTYEINRMVPEIEVTILHRESGKSSFRRGELTPPGGARTPQPAPGQTFGPGQTQARSTFELLGFSLSANRSNGYLTVKDVEVGTVAHVAGMRTGTPIIAIDGNKTTQMMHDQVEAYITKRAETGSTVTVQFKTGNGALKTVVLKPKL